MGESQLDLLITNNQNFLAMTLAWEKQFTLLNAVS